LPLTLLNALAIILLLQEAKNEAEILKRDKLLEVKEKYLQLKSEHENFVANRKAKLQSTESSLKQKELTLNHQQEDLNRKKSEVDVIKDNLDNQLKLIESKKVELEKLYKQELDQLESISGLSAEQAKEKLIEVVKEEAKADAVSYINEIMEEAKMTANKEG